MQAPITVNYVPDGEDWAITVTRDEETRQAKAPGLIAARDRADQLVEQLAPNPAGHRTVVHLLEGDAVAFTTNYLHARLGLAELPPVPPTPAALVGAPLAASSAAGSSLPGSSLAGSSAAGSSVPGSSLAGSSAGSSLAGSALAGSSAGSALAGSSPVAAPAPAPAPAPNVPTQPTAESQVTKGTLPLQPTPTRPPTTIPASPSPSPTTDPTAADPTAAVTDRPVSVTDRPVSVADQTVAVSEAEQTQVTPPIATAAGVPIAPPTPTQTDPVP